LSREQYPKQLLKLAGHRSLLQQTLLRLEGMNAAADPLVICNEEHRFLVLAQVREIATVPARIILEPVGKNTAPAATIAALALIDYPDALMLLMSADHRMGNVPAFQHAVQLGVPLAQNGKLVTFGVTPTAAETGYGYIRCGRDHQVVAFVEKPDAETAQRFLQEGGYLWNSGIFLVRADVWLAEIGRYRPEILEACRIAYDNGKPDANFYRVGRDAFTGCPSESIDYAVMENTTLAAVVPLDADWSDIGAWSTLWQIGPHDDAGNVIQGDVLTHATRNALVIAQHRLVATVGLDDVIVIETPDAVLVASREHASSVRNIVEQLSNERRAEHRVHRRVYRPWGSYESVDAGERFQVKRLVVAPGATLSLQLHHHRAEHWVVVCGTARVTRGDDVFLLSENQSAYIPLGVKHRLENPGSIPLEIVEIQSGAYLGEDDIIRFEDVYDRSTTAVARAT